MREHHQNIILTHPFRGNYGGMLQAYALWLSVSQCRLEAGIADYLGDASPFSLGRFIKRQIRWLQLTLGLTTSATPVSDDFKQEQADKFRRLVRCVSCPEAGGASEAATWIVGSDQVWRGAYAKALKSLPFFFLDFLPESVRRRSIAYAASFGTVEWEGTQEETIVCRELLQQFKCVSVREESGIRICKDVFGVEAIRMPDPTFLLDAEAYKALINSEKTKSGRAPYLAAYLLDEKPPVSAMLCEVAEKLGLALQHLLPHATAGNRGERFPLSVPQWLRYILEAECVVTDSFHGCVFAVIFNKPFVCLGNKARGTARFETLLRTYHLESRMAAMPEEVLEIMQVPIDWGAINAIREGECGRGRAFLHDNLL